MTDPQAAAERLMKTCDSAYIVQAMGCNTHTMKFSSDLFADIHTVCEAVAAAPQWRDKPTCIGWWVVWYPPTSDGYANRDVQYVSEDEMEDDWDGLPVFGPLPAPPEPKAGA